MYVAMAPRHYRMSAAFLQGNVKHIGALKGVKKIEKIIDMDIVYMILYP